MAAGRRGGGVCGRSAGVIWAGGVVGREGRKGRERGELLRGGLVVLGGLGRGGLRTLVAGGVRVGWLGLGFVVGVGKARSRG